MTKLYYVPGACSLASHISLREAGLPFQLELVDVQRGKQLADGRSYAAVTPKAYVPALELDDGQIITEGAVILWYLADRLPDEALAPRAGLARIRVQEWVHYISTELHKGLTPLFMPVCPPEVAKQARERFVTRLEFVAQHLLGRRFIGDRFSIADAYLFYVLRSWQRHLQGELPSQVDAYYRVLADRPSIRAALEAERLAA